MTAFDENDNVIGEELAYSIGGGDIVYDCELDESKTKVISKDAGNYNIYPITLMREIQDWSEKNGRGYWEYVEWIEESDI